MKVTVDTEAGTVYVDRPGTLGELTDYLSYFYPDTSWRDLKIDRPVLLEKNPKPEEVFKKPNLY